MNRKTRSTSPLDIAMATLAGASAAFALFAIPHGAFQGAVALSGLPLILPAAQPPLGETARLLAAAIAGACTFALAWLVLRSIGKPPAAPKYRPEPVEIEIAPRIKRADAHPDAPARRPILAGLEFGEPAEPEAEREALLSLEPDMEVEAEEETPLPSIQAEEPRQEVAPLRSECPHPAQLEPNSIADLMQRLELGLARRDRSSESAAPIEPVWQTAPTEHAIDERLRGAIADLQKLAARS